MRRVLRGWLALAVLLPLTVAAQLYPDVPYVTTPWNVVETMLDLGEVTGADHLIDLGSGDGRIVIEAVKKRGARGFGIELNPHLVRIAMDEAKKQGIAGRAGFAEGNLFTFDLSAASVLTMYLFPQINIQLRPRLFEQLKPGSRVVSHDFHMDEWKPDAQREVAVPGKSYGPPRSTIYMWVIPANAAGKWRWQLPAGGAATAFEVTIAQRFQRLEMTASIDGAKAAVGNAQLRGDEIRFSLTRERGPATFEFAGRIEGDTLAGTVRSGMPAEATAEWKALRAERGKIRLD
jgi:hypothetical protein